MLKLAITTCQAKTSLTPVVISTGFRAEFRSWLELRGVQCHEVHSSVSDAVYEANRTHNYPLHAIGNYLRYEACSVLEDEYFLYCDGDVIFLKEPEWRLEPALFAAAPERELSDVRINSGVLLINNKAFRAELQNFFSFARENLVRFYPGFDQPALNEFFCGRFDQLPPTLNWRSYWGERYDVSILHLHAFRPNLVRKLLAGEFIGQVLQQELLIDLTEQTLKHLEYFLGQLGDREKFSSVEHYQELSELGAIHGRALTHPVRALFEVANKTRSEERNSASVYRAALLKRAIVDGSIARLDVSTNGRQNVRVLISKCEGLLAISDLKTKEGSVAGSLREALQANLVLSQNERVEKSGYYEVLAPAGGQAIDIVFRLSDKLEAGDLSMHFISTSSLTVSVFRGDGVNWEVPEIAEIHSMD